jgi:nitroimidazol reductase NimA-like FMN-containing flavoprotein (pyridoxamine 5'-phosphate oxidase superfamily)
MHTSVKTNNSLEKIYAVIFQREVKVVVIMTEMSKTEIRKFLMQDTLTGKLATLKKNRSPHVVPIWFILDDNNNNNSSSRDRVGDIIFTTDSTSVKVVETE